MSAHSLAIYLQSFPNDFSSLLFNSSSVDEMIRVNPDNNTDVQVGLIWNWRILNGTRLVGHLGIMPGITNLIMANEKRTLGVIILSDGDITKFDETIENLMTQLFDCFE
jgi:hypothetical protein